MTSGIYDNPYSCNKCGKENDVKGDPFHPEASGEVDTECKECGHKDHWSFEFFESGQDGLNASGKY